MLSFFGQTGRGRILKIGDPFKVTEPFGVDFEVSLDGYTTIIPSGSFALPIAINLNNPLGVEYLTKAEHRTSELNVGALRFREEYQVTFPEGITPQEPVPMEFANGVGSYRKSAKLDGRKLKISREFVITKDVVSVGEYPQFRELVSKMVDNYNVEIKYVSTLTGTRPTPVVPQVAVQRSPYDLPEYLETRDLTPRQASALEARLVKDPDDFAARRDLLRYYSSYLLKNAKDTPARASGRIKHYSWFIGHHPEMAEVEIFGPRGIAHTIQKPEADTITNLWITAVSNDKTNSAVRVNAFEFIRRFDPVRAEELMMEGLRLKPSEYAFPFRLSETFSKKPDDLKPESDIERKVRVAKQVKYGQMALDLLKTERSSERSEQRMRLLQVLANAAFDAEDYVSAKKLATELILDFGQHANSSNYDSASHIGNIVLGRVALKEGSVTKAAEYLLIAIRAPLRKENSWLPEIDTTLAKELLKAGGKDAVLEYLELCKGLWNIRNEKKLFENQAIALKKWQDQIKNGQEPSFDFYKP